MKEKLINLLGPTWFKALESYVMSDSFLNIAKSINKERREQKQIIYPEEGSDLLFKAFRTIEPSNTKVVILGQDPYADGSYDGYAFSNGNKKDGKISPSLDNILKEVNNNYPENFEINFPDNLTPWNLERWVKQGVLLINTAHTVVQGKPGSHLSKWKEFTKNVINELNKHNYIVWLLWGNHAISFSEYITNKTHFLIRTSHPSPLSNYKMVGEFVPFSGSNCFKICNEYLSSVNKNEILW